MFLPHNDFKILQVNAREEYYKENDGGDQLKLKYLFDIFLFLIFSLKNCSDGRTMGSARCSYSLRDNLLDHGHLQVHLGLVDLQIIHPRSPSLAKDPFAIK